MLPIFPVLKPKVSLIFINYQSIWHLQRSLESLCAYESSGIEREIIVVNNDPSEEKALFILQKRYLFILVRSNTNEGFAKAANLGASVATGELLGFINPDTLWIEEVLPQVVSDFAILPSCGALGIQLVDEKGNLDVFDSGKEVSALLTLAGHLLFTRRRTNLSLQRMGWVSGGALFLKKALFLSLGGFNEEYFLYFEDVDLCQRIRKNGLHVYKDSRIKLLHYGGKSHSSEASKKQYYYASQDLYFQKHRPYLEGKIISFVRVLVYGK